MDDVRDLYPDGTPKFWPTKPDLPRAQLSRIELGLGVAIPLDAVAKAEEFYSALARPPGYDASWTRVTNQSRHLSIGFDIGALGATCCSVECSLDFTTRRRPHPAITAIGYFALDLIPATRKILDRDFDVSTPCSHGGADSYVCRSAGGDRECLGIQLDLLTVVCRNLMAIFARAAGCEPSSLSSDVWLYGLELFRDRLSWDTTGMVREMSRMPPAGAREMKPKYAASRSGNSLCVSWNDYRKGTPVRKAYGMGFGIVRTAVELRNRAEICTLMLTARAGTLPARDLAGNEVAAAVVDTARDCVPILDELAASLTAVERSRLTAMAAQKFVALLGPLMCLGARAPGARDPVGRKRQARSPGGGLAGDRVPGGRRRVRCVPPQRWRRGAGSPPGDGRS